MRMCLLNLLFLIAMPIGASASSFEYLPSYELNSGRSALVSALPSGFFLPVRRLNGQEQHFYHGTSMANAIEIINTKQVIVGGKDNILVSGKGWYFFSSLQSAMSYGSEGGSKVTDEGMVIPAKIKDQAVILDWNEARDAPFFQNILKAHGEDGYGSPKKTFDHLGTLGIDIIRWGPTNTEVIVLNKEAINVPGSISELAEYYQSIQNGYEKKVFSGENHPNILIDRLEGRQLVFMCSSLFK